MARDNFTCKTKELLAKRAAYRCSNPHCRRYTVGASTLPNKVIQIGVAAHITAAAPGGPRFDPSLSKEQRKSPENGIWLCPSCASMIDQDILYFTVERLLTWKRDAEFSSNMFLYTNEMPEQI